MYGNEDIDEVFKDFCVIYISYFYVDYYFGIVSMMVCWNKVIVGIDVLFGVIVIGGFYFWMFEYDGVEFLGLDCVVGIVFYCGG